MEPEPLAGPRVTLTPLRVDDAASMVAVLADPELYRFTGGEPPSLEVLVERYRRQVVGGEDGSSTRSLHWIVRHRGEPIGYAQATVQGEPGAHLAELAGVLGSRWQGKGFAAEAGLLLTQWLETQGVHRFLASIHPEHVASERLAARLGLAQAGAAPPQDEGANGELVWDTVAAPGTDLMASVRIAGKRDIDRAAATLATAFADYPWTRWVVPEEEYLGRLRELQQLYLGHAERHGLVLIAGECEGVIALLPADAPAPEPRVIERIIELHGERAERLAAAADDHADGSEGWNPDRGAWALETLGVDPSSRNRGIGSALITAGLREARVRGAETVTLKTSDARNVALYARHGFVVTAHLSPGLGPELWAMRWQGAAAGRVPLA